MKTEIIVAVLLLAIAAIADARKSAISAQRAQPLQRPASADKSDGIPCLFDLERGEVPNCLHKSADGELFVAPQIAKQLDFDAHGLAVIRSGSEGWMYVNRSRKVVIAGVPSMDNWADSFHDGLVRFVRNGKYGFANRAGHIVIPPIYDGAMNFDSGTATVCNGCKSKSVGEHHVFSGGEWFHIDSEGTVLARLPTPD